ncbi:MAG TPA: ATP-binding protein, partial [Sphingomicrobium sp.]
GSRAQRLVANAMEGAQRGAALTQRLLAFARRQDLRPESLDVPALVRGLSEMLERSLGPQVHITTRFPLRLPAAHVDAHQLELAILNMGVNARDAMPDGGTLTISACEDIMPPREGSRGGRYLRVDVVDDGTGMDPDTLARASEPFFTTKGTGKGTGLGLSMVQGLAAQSGGHLQIESALGRGTTVSLWLPLADRPPASAVVTPGDKIPELPPLSILVVDDDSLVLRNTAAMLEDLGHSVLTGASGAEGLAQLSRGRHFDLLVTDQLMPNMTGVQLAQAAVEIMPRLPVLLVSGFAELAPHEAQNFEFLHKPFNQHALAVAVARTYASRKIVSLREHRAATSA